MVAGRLIFKVVDAPVENQRRRPVVQRLQPRRIPSRLESWQRLSMQETVRHQLASPSDSELA